MDTGDSTNKFYTQDEFSVLCSKEGILNKKQIILLYRIYVASWLGNIEQYEKELLNYNYYIAMRYLNTLN